jgi:hypothetical protein
MTSGEKDHKGGRSGVRKGDDARAARLKAALRENLRRRKAQARQRSAGGEGPAHDSAGFVPDKSKD